MVLEKYKQKCNFSATPEPSGDPKIAAERSKKAKPEPEKVGVGAKKDSENEPKDDSPGDQAEQPEVE